MNDHHYGKDCPKGKVQVEFVSCSPSDKRGEYGWKPVENATIDVYIDGERFFIQVGDFHDGVAYRRGLHIIGPTDISVDKTSSNGASIFRSVATQADPS